MATLSTYTTTVQNIADDTSNRATNVIQKGIQFAYNRVVTELKGELIEDSDSTQAISMDTREVTLDIEPQRILQAYYKLSGETEYSRLESITAEEYTRKDFSPTNTGRPQKYYVLAGKLYFDKITEDTGTLRLIVTPASNNLTGSITSVVPDRYEQVIIDGALAYFFRYEGDTIFQSYSNSFEKSLNVMIAEMKMLQPNESHPRIKLMNRK